MLCSHTENAHNINSAARNRQEESGDPKLFEGDGIRRIMKLGNQLCFIAGSQAMHENTVASPTGTNSFGEGLNKPANGDLNGDNSRQLMLADRVRRAVMILENSVESRKDVLGGVPVLKGTRFSVGQLFAELAEGENIDTLASDCELDREALSTLLHALAVCLSDPMAP
jgi:uncharacterized protein (DUF433 family)